MQVLCFSGWCRILGCCPSTFSKWSLKKKSFGRIPTVGWDFGSLVGFHPCGQFVSLDIVEQSLWSLSRVTIHLGRLILGMKKGSNGRFCVCDISSSQKSRSRKYRTHSSREVESWNFIIANPFEQETFMIPCFSTLSTWGLLRHGEIRKPRGPHVPNFS